MSLLKEKIPYIKPYPRSGSENTWEKKNSENLSQINVDIYGSHYIIKGEANPDYIYSLAKYVNEKMEEVANNTSNLTATKVAILAALNIADEFFQHRELCDQSVADVEKKTKRLISILNQGIIGDIYP